MGRIKTALVKRITEELIEKYASEFTESFDENKPKVTQHISASSKKLRNIITGYITRLHRKRAEA